MHDEAEARQPERHPLYYHQSPIIIQVENTLYRVDKSILRRFQVFRDMFDGAAEFNKERDEGQTDKNPIRLQGVTTFEMDSLLGAVNHDWWDGPPAFSLEQWKAILHLATMWDLPELRICAIQGIDTLKPSSIDFIILGQKYQVHRWIKQAYVQLCSRQEPLTVEEGVCLGVDLLIVVSQLRERVRYIPKPIFSCGSCEAKGDWWCRTCRVQCDANTEYHCRKCKSRASFWCAICKTYNSGAFPPPQPPDLMEVAEKVVEEYLASAL